MAALQLLAAAGRHFATYAEYYSGHKDAQRIINFRPALTGSAGVWYDGLFSSESPALRSWTDFAALFRAMYALLQGLQSPWDHLASLHMEGEYLACPDFVAEFNARVSLLPSGMPVGFLVSSFRRGLSTPLARQVDASQVNRFGRATEWPSLAEIASAAVALAPSLAPEPLPTLVLTTAAVLLQAPASLPTPAFQTHKFGPDGKLTAAAAKAWGGCSWCR